ncbi:MAG TPA: OmpA family protein [Gammaproteobacteria bacterium]|nr:OmpA family protein [Gammaproteobacteria bacterium]
MLLRILLIIYIDCCIFLMGCASSAVSRDVTSNIDRGVKNANDLYNNTANGYVGDTYQNANQTAKGAAIGSATGAVAGAFSSGIGVIPGAVTGAFLGASYGSYIDSNTSLEDQLENRGAIVIILGQQILIAIPSDRIFDAMTSNVKPQAYSTLELITKYINQYTKTLVKVAAYTAASGSPHADLVLSKQQADNVAKLLLASGVNARILYAEGYGGTHLVVKNTVEWHESDNYRIEITLEKLHV